jgi:hypothetical protein
MRKEETTSNDPAGTAWSPTSTALIKASRPQRSHVFAAAPTHTQQQTSLAASESISVARCKMRERHTLFFQTKMRPLNERPPTYTEKHKMKQTADNHPRQEILVDFISNQKRVNK